MTTASENDDGPATPYPGNTRRILVQDLPPEESPKIKGRKLESPSAARASTEHQPDPTPQLEREGYNRVESALVTKGLRGPAGRRKPAQDAAVIPSLKPTNPGVNVKKLLLIVGTMIALPSALLALLFLLPSGASRKTTGVGQPSPPSERPTASPSVPLSVTEVTAPATNVDSSPTGSNAISLELAEIRSMSVQLASQISQKSGYEFAPEFVEVIRAHTQTYSDKKAVEGAGRYRREINKSFRDEGLNPLIGYALAMSRSKFDPSLTERGFGIWQVPTVVVRSQGYLSADESDSRLNNPEASAQIAASYTKQLLSTFDADDFMYALACFGMSLQEAGRLQARLTSAAPDKDRRDIMKVIRTGALSEDQIDNIARFFAAGIVGENPQKFGLDDTKPFSSLY